MQTKSACTPLGSANITSIRLAFSPALKLYCPTSRRARETSDSHRPCNDGKFPLWRCTALAKLLPAWRNQIMNRRKLLQAAGLGLVTTAIAKPAIAHAQGPIKIGLIQSMTGPFNDTGKAVVNGAQ